MLLYRCTKSTFKRSFSNSSDINARKGQTMSFLKNLKAEHYVGIILFLLVVVTVGVAAHDSYQIKQEQAEYARQVAALGPLMEKTVNNPEIGKVTIKYYLFQPDVGMVYLRDKEDNFYMTKIGNLDHPEHITSNDIMVYGRTAVPPTPLDTEMVKHFVSIFDVLSPELEKTRGKKVS